LVTHTSGYLLIIPAPAYGSPLALQLALSHLSLLLLPVLAPPLFTHGLFLLQELEFCRLGNLAKLLLGFEAYLGKPGFGLGKERGLGTGYVVLSLGKLGLFYFLFIAVLLHRIISVESVDETLEILLAL
jgi:hypothetical protein